MTVDESREHQFVSRVDVLPGGVPRFQFRAWADRDNRVAGDHDRAVVVNVAWAVHGNDGPGDDRIGTLFGGLPVEENGERNLKHAEQAACQFYIRCSLFHVVCYLYISPGQFLYND